MDMASATGTTTIWILGDQLAHDHAALTAFTPRTARVLMVESKARGSVHRYHQLKLVLIYSAMRHFAAELRAQGWQVDYITLDQGETFESALRTHVSAHGTRTLVVAQPHSFAETDAIDDLAHALGLALKTLQTTQFLVTREDFRDWAAGQKRLLMEQHYRRMRKRFGWLMQDDGEPMGGAWNFDADNRQTFAAWKRAGAPSAATVLRESPDAITREVMALVAREFADNPGSAATFWLPVDRAGARRWLTLFVDERLPRFGAFEDMMSTGEPVLFHSVLSPLINIGLLTPRECVEAAVAAHARGAAPLNSVEGFVRQIVGWREFVNGVYWLRGPEYGALNALDAQRPLPAWFYTGATPMHCLHDVLQQTLDMGWNHHIQRLMVLGNFMLMAGISPQQGLRWFLEMYVDGFDWVMAANVIGMSLHADGGFMATKPYAATSAYIRKMSNYCAGCRFKPDLKTGPDACPFNYLYWDFIGRHESRFAKNVRMLPIVKSWSGRSTADKEAVHASARTFLDAHVPV